MRPKQWFSALIGIVLSFAVLLLANLLGSPLRHDEWIAIRHVFFRVASWIAAMSLLANFLPAAEKIQNPTVRDVYEVAIGIVAAIALNWRADLPSLDAEFMGFRRRLRHYRRDRAQTRLDQAYRDAHSD